MISRLCSKQQMRTALTIYKKADGKWALLADPDVAADKQRHAFNNIGTNWPKDAVLVRYQSGDGIAKVATKDKAEAIAKQMRDVAKRVEEKAAGAIKREEERKVAEKEEAEKKAKADAEQRAREVADKEATKKATRVK